MKKTEPLSLRDLKPRFEDIPVQAGTLRVYGLSATAIYELLERFPAAQGLAVGRGIKIADLKAQGKEALGAFIAAATGELGDPEAEKAAAALDAEVQIEILEAMGRSTFSKGFGPFAQKLLAISLALSVEASRGPAMNSPKPSPPSPTTMPDSTLGA